MATTACYYHPEKMAVSTCERCHRPICLEDKRMYHQTHYVNNNYGNSNFGSSSYETTREYCILCYAAQKQSNVTGSIIGGAIFIIFLIFGISMFTSFTNSFNSFGPSMGNSPFSNFMGLFMLFAIFIIILIVGGIIYSKLQSDQAVDEAMRFRNSLNTDNIKSSSGVSNLTNSFKPLYQKKRAIGTLTCFECGGTLNFEDQFCPRCGNDTKDELRAYSNSQ